jgi:hypothetical protein
MKLFRKYLFLTAVVVLASFASVLAAECVHHHDDFKDRDQCALCNWVRTVSQADLVPLAPTFVPVLLFFELFIFISFFNSFSLISPCGRSPPTNLL